MAALPRTISSAIPAMPTTIASATTRTSSSSTPSDSITTPSEGSVSRPENGGATKAATVSAITSRPKTTSVRRCSNRKVKRGREKRSSHRISFISPLRNFCWRGPASCMRRQRAGSQMSLAPGDQLQAKQGRDHLEHLPRASGGQRQGGNAEEEHEQQRKAAAAEQRDQTVERLVAVAVQPPPKLGARRLARAGLPVGHTHRLERVLAAREPTRDSCGTRSPRPPSSIGRALHL